MGKDNNSIGADIKGYGWSIPQSMKLNAVPEAKGFNSRLILDVQALIFIAVSLTICPKEKQIHPHNLISFFVLNDLFFVVRSSDSKLVPSNSTTPSIQCVRRDEI